MQVYCHSLAGVIILFYATYADRYGNAYADEHHTPVGRFGYLFAELATEQLIPLPEGATLMLIPGRSAVGVDATGRFRRLGSERYALAALLPQGYTRVALPAWHGDGPKLPLFGYTAVAWREGSFYAAAKVEDEQLYKWAPGNYNTEDMEQLLTTRLEEMPNNPIIAQLAGCVREYGCFTAQNIFYRRWEGGIPVSSNCNAACVGCISEQEAECCPSPQSRIKYQPSPEQIVAAALPHLMRAEDAIVSFGQGCEGEPMLQHRVITAAISQIRSSTSRGTINANTNAGFTEGVKAVVDAGIDSLRVSINSAIEANYQAYYRPRGYALADVRRSIEYAKSHGVYVALNLLAFPGVTDREDELEALIELIRNTGVDMVQVRNLNIDPEDYSQLMRASRGELYGLEQLSGVLKSEVAGLQVGSFSRPVR